MDGSSSSTDTTNTKQSQNQVAQEGDGIGISAGDNARIYTTSQEAWALGTDAIEAIAANSDATITLLGQSIGEIGKSHDTLAAALDMSTQAAKSEAGQISEQLIKIGVPAAAIAFVAYGVFSK